MMVTLLCLDVETTGIDKQTDLPVQVGLVMRRDGVDQILIDMLANPGRPIPPEAAAVHGITDAQVAGAPSAYAVVDYLAKMVDYYAYGGEAYTVGFNSNNFDIPLINHILQRRAFSVPHIDVLRMVRRHFPEVKGEKGGKSLGELHQVFLRRPLENAHGAVADIIGTLNLLRALQVKAGVTLAQLAAEQAQPMPYTVMPLGKYTGVPVDEVPRSWAQFMSDKDLDPDLRATVDYILQR
jgi:DNA polymerase-3 subunit epsilon